MRHAYICPHCDHHSTRRWNLDVHIKRKHGEYLVGRSLGQYVANNPPLYNQSVHLGHPTVADSIDNTLPQEAVLGTSQYFPSPMYPPVDVAQSFANPMNRPMPAADGKRYGNGLSWGAVQKIQVLKGLMNKYPQYCSDGIIRLAIYNSINGDDSLLDGQLEQLRNLDSLANIKF